MQQLLFDEREDNFEIPQTQTIHTNSIEEKSEDRNSSETTTLPVKYSFRTSGENSQTVPTFPLAPHF
jgi:hypothetical protein